MRGRAADALEKVGRTEQDAIAPYIDKLIDTHLEDDVPMVRWHMAMLLGHLVIDASHRARIKESLLDLLGDPSVFVASWAVTSLCLVAYLDPSTTDEIVRAIGPLKENSSVALRTRAGHALAALTDPAGKIPPDWIKSERLRQLIYPSKPDLSP